MHPYYDHNALIEEQWVFATASHESPASISYYVDPSAHWDPDLKLRVVSHFKDSKLAARYAVQAANQLSTLRDTLAIYYKAQGVKGVQFHLNT
mgnify:CR=1 FL=1